MSRAAVGGAPVAAAVQQVAEDARREAAAAAERAARRAGVLAVGPLGLCFLPAFLLLGVVPAVIGLAASAAQQPLSASACERTVHSGQSPSTTSGRSAAGRLLADSVAGPGIPPGPASGPAGADSEVSMSSSTPIRTAVSWLTHVRLSRGSCVPRPEAGMATAEYAVATVAACGFAGVLYKLITSDLVMSLLKALISHAFHLSF